MAGKKQHSYWEWPIDRWFDWSTMIYLLKKGVFPSKHGDFPFAHGVFRSKHSDFPLKHDDFRYFSINTWWFSIVMLNSQRAIIFAPRLQPQPEPALEMPQWVSCKAIEQKAAPGGRRAGIWRLLQQEKHPKMMGNRFFLGVSWGWGNGWSLNLEIIGWCCPGN